MDGLRVERTEMGRVEQTNPHGGRQPEQRHEQGSGKRRPPSDEPDRLAQALRRSNRAGGEVTHTRTEVFRDAYGEPRIRVWDVATHKVVTVLTPVELARLVNEAGTLPGLLFEGRG